MKEKPMAKKRYKVNQFFRKVNWWLHPKKLFKQIAMYKKEIFNLKTENQQLKSEQNKVAVEKLEDLLAKLRKLEYQQVSTFKTIYSMIEKLKGESDE